MAKKLLHQFSHTFDGQIWRTEVDPQSGKMALEIRSPEKHTVHFALLDTDSGRLLWQDLDAGTGWYGGMLALHGTYLLVHGYGERPDPGEEDKVVIIDTGTGQVKWEIEHVRFLRTAGEAEVLLFSTVEEGHPALLANLETGEMDYVEVESPRPAGITQKYTKGLVMPLHYPEENQHFATLAELVQHITGHTPGNEIEYAEWGDCVVISYYLYKEAILDNFLLITDKAGIMLSHELLGEDMRGKASDSFFILQDKLLFIKNKRTISVYGQ
ncbi:DUF4905 domain-containing protein [Roseivirga sp. BDSF3-8]|uniref:DUF4905 domain-containing protein n=1 Tax=Roseivirga sp. BDSF3-8 TaxID=3241598 RepID=UPI003531FCBE